MLKENENRKKQNAASTVKETPRAFGQAKKKWATHISICLKSSRCRGKNNRKKKKIKKKKKKKKKKLPWPKQRGQRQGEEEKSQVWKKIQRAKRLEGQRRKVNKTKGALRSFLGGWFATALPHASA
jgi:hypothetical protein